MRNRDMTPEETEWFNSLVLEDALWAVYTEWCDKHEVSLSLSYFPVWKQDHGYFEDQVVDE